MKPIRIYTHLGKKEKIAGLELFDWGLLLIVYAVVFLVSTNLIINVAVFASAFCALKVYKYKKPPKYTESLIRFILKSKYRTAAKEEQGER